MEQFKDYLKKLFEGKNISIKKQHLSLFEEFSKDERNREIYEKIYKFTKEFQTSMTEKWKEKTEIEDLKAELITLPNGTVGKHYNFIFDFDKLKLPNIGNFNLEIEEKLGLTFNKEEKKLSGIFKEAGEHTLVLNFKLKNAKDEKPFNAKEIKLVINPDPKSLWKNEPSDRNDKYWKEDNESSFSIFGEKKLIVGSKRGRSHAHEGKFRDDAFKIKYDEKTGWGIIAVADGAGSAKYSRAGSEIACNTVIDFFNNIAKEKLEEIEISITNYFKNDSEENQKIISGFFVEQLGKAAFTAQGKIREEAAKQNAEIKDYSTTLIFAMIKKYGNKFVIASFWVGDGGIGIYCRDKNEAFILGTPDSGEFAGQTRFLTMSDIFTDGAYAKRVRFKIVEDFTALLLMTDGISDPKFQTDANLNRIEKWNELWEDLNGNNEESCKIDFTKQNEEAVKELMNWLNFWSPGNHDDRTLAIIY